MTGFGMAFWIFWLGCTLIAVVAAKGVAKNCLFWWHNRRRPIITASAAELTAYAAEWPLASSPRWPPPGTKDLVDTRTACRAWARAASQREKVVRFKAEAILVVGSAALGVQLPSLLTIGHNIYVAEEPIRAGVREAGLISELFWTLVRLSPLASVVLIIIGFVLRHKADILHEAAVTYRRASQFGPQVGYRINSPSPQRSRRTTYVRPGLRTIDPSTRAARRGLMRIH